MKIPAIFSRLMAMATPRYFLYPAKLKDSDIIGSSTLNNYAQVWTVNEVAGVLERSIGPKSVFDNINARKLAKVMKMLAVREGSTIIEQGESGPSGLFLILSGYVYIQRGTHGSAGAKLIAVVGPGDVIGEMHLMDGRPRSASCIAQTDVQLAALSAKDYRTLPKSNPGGALMLSMIISQQQTDRLRKSTFKSLFYENLLDVTKGEVDL